MIKYIYNDVIERNPTNMNQALEIALNIFPDKIIKSISNYPDLCNHLSEEARLHNRTIKSYLLDNDFSYANEYPLKKLDKEIQAKLAEINIQYLNTSILREKHIYNSINQVTRFYGLSVTDYIESLGYNYHINRITNNLDYSSARRMHDNFNFTFAEIGDIIGLSKQRIESLLNSNRKINKNWRTTDFTNVKDIFLFMCKNHLFEFCANGTRFLIKNDLQKEVCLVWYNEIESFCAFTEDVPSELLKIIEKEKMNCYCTEDFEILEDIEIVNKLKKPYIKVLNQTLFRKASKKHNMDGEQYSKFLGYEGHLTIKDTNIDSRFIEFFEQHLIDGEVYISSDPQNQWIKSFVHRNTNMSLDEFIEFYGYKKASRGKFSTLDSYIQNEKAHFKTELATIAIDGKVQPQGSLYQRLNIFAKKNGISLNELIQELGFERKSGKTSNRILSSENIIKNSIEELNRDIENAIKLQRTCIETEERKIQLIARNKKLVSRLKSIYGCKCQLCKEDEWLPIQMNNGTYYSEVHHIKALSEGKDEEELLDVLSNMIVVCPNHHKMLHFHLGGFTSIVKENNNLFFVNDSDTKIKIIDNYHLSPTANM